MKKFVAITLLFCFMNFNLGAFALEETVENVSQSAPSVTLYDDAPKWEDYVAPKYRNPRTDFSKGSSITELSVGALLTELIITAPIGVPLLVHGTTKVKMGSYANRKKIFEEEIAKARTIEDPDKRAQEYTRILSKCNLKESTKRHYEKKYAKKQKKLAKKQAKNAEKSK